MSKSRKLPVLVLIGALLTALLAASLIVYATHLKRIQVLRVACSNPSSSLSRSDRSIILAYVRQEEMWAKLARPPSDRRAEAIVQLGLEELKRGDPGLFVAIARRWNSANEYPTLVSSVVDAVNSEMPGAGIALTEIRALGQKPDISQINLSHLLSKANDKVLLMSLITVFKDDGILRHQDSYAALLKRTDIGEDIKNALRARLETLNK